MDSYSFKTRVKSRNITYETSKSRLQLMLRPRPAGGAYDAPPDPLVGWGQGKLPPLSSRDRHLTFSALSLGFLDRHFIASLILHKTRSFFVTVRRESMPRVDEMDVDRAGLRLNWA